MHEKKYWLYSVRVISYIEKTYKLSYKLKVIFDFRIKTSLYNVKVILFYIKENCIIQSENFHKTFELCNLSLLDYIDKNLLWITQSDFLF